MTRLRWFLIIGLCWGILSGADETVLEVIPLKYRSIAEVLPVLQPFVGSEGALSGMNGQLIVRATPRDLAQIRKILDRIDTLPRQLRISVRQATQAEMREEAAEVSGQVRAGDVRISVPAHERGGASLEAEGARARVWRSGVAGQDEAAQSVQVMEGRQAFIRIGQDVPLQETTVIQGGAASRIVQGTAYRETGTGFYVMPRLSGDRVTLEISAQKEALDGSHGGQSVDTQKLATTVSGRLGEWIQLGGLARQKDGSGTGWIYGTRHMGSDTRQVWVKVEEIR